MVYQTVIFSHRYFDNNNINFKLWILGRLLTNSEQHYTTPTLKFNSFFFYRTSTMLNNVFNNSISYNTASWDPEGRYHYSKMFHWEPEGHYHCTKSMAIAPFWFSTEHRCSFNALLILSLRHIVSWEPEGRYCTSKMFHWEPRRALSLYKVYGDNALMDLNGTSLHSFNALLILSLQYMIS